VILNRKFHFPRVQWNTFHCTLCECNCILYVLFHCTLCVLDKSHPSKCFSYEPISLFWYYIKQIMNVYSCMFIRMFIRVLFGERWNVPFNSAVASLNGTFHLSPHENILTIARINICIQYNTIPYHTVPYHTIPYHTIPYHTIPYHTITYKYNSIYCSIWYATLQYN
jgi:hypothetical protein